MTQLPTRLRDKLLKTLALLDSPSDGEALAAARAVSRILGACGVEWDELISGKAGVHVDSERTMQGEHPVNMLNWVDAVGRLSLILHLNMWERGFIFSMRERVALGRRPTLKQLGVIQRMWSEYIGGAV